MFAPSEEELIGTIRASMPVAASVVERPRPLTADEAARVNNEIDARVNVARIFGDRADSGATGISALDTFVAEKERGELEKLLGPGQRSKNALQAMIDSAVEEAVSTFRKSAVATRRETEREGIVPRMAAASQGDNSDAAKFVRAFVAGDEEGMRRVARELASAAA